MMRPLRINSHSYDVASSSKARVRRRKQTEFSAQQYAGVNTGMSGRQSARCVSRPTPHRESSAGPPPVKSEAALRGPPPCWKNLWPTGASGRSPACQDRSARGRAHQPFAAVQGLAKKVPLPAAPAHAEGTSDGKRGGTGGPAPATAQRQAEAGDIVL